MIIYVKESIMYKFLGVSGGVVHGLVVESLTFSVSMVV
jgi:hypothetical protein